MKYEIIKRSLNDVLSDSFLNNVYYENGQPLLQYGYTELFMKIFETLPGVKKVEVMSSEYSVVRCENDVLIYNSGNQGIYFFHNTTDEFYWFDTLYYSSVDEIASEIKNILEVK
jgi:hypothetical protein